MLTRTHPSSIHVRDKNNNWIPRQPNPVEKNLYNESTFYPAFTKEMLAAKREIIIYSPFVSKYRSDTFNSILYKLKDKNVDIFIFTRPTNEYEREQRKQAEAVLARYEEMGATIFYLQGSIHEKPAIIDRETLGEGSLNILSQRTSREMMRRITDESAAMQVMTYLGLNRMLAEAYRAKYERLYRALMEQAHPQRTVHIRTIILSVIAIIIGWWLFDALSDMIPLKVVVTLLNSLATTHPH